MSGKWLNAKELGRRLRELRGPLTQAELAVRSGRPGSQTEISKLETGDWKGDEPNVPLLAAIAEVAGVTLDYFRDTEDADEARRERTTVARWLRKMADELDATSRPTGAEVVATRKGVATTRKGGKRAGGSGAS